MIIFLYEKHICNKDHWSHVLHSMTMNDFESRENSLRNSSSSELGLDLRFPLVCIVQSQQTGLEPYCDYIFFRRALYCFRFTSLDQLDFSNSTLEYQQLVIQPNSDLKLEFNSSLNLKGLRLTRNAFIEIGNFYGFDPYFQPFGSIQISDPDRIFSFYIYDSRIFFIDNVTCNFSEEEGQNSFIFSGLNLNRLQFSNVNFTSELCPLLFKNTSVQDWYFINKDPVKYDPSLNSSLIQMDLNIKVKRLFVEYGEDKFISKVNTDTLLNEFIFEQVEEIYFFSCNLEEIFKNLISPALKNRKYF
ncbi:hypothetical protein BpHYR1_035769 [Brachionus plicatilis]|uniref:Uncharacterized protein n=1 Tax=Brachionus plicatilis TaxID=10195 RepID=A0A3M7P9K8_BRAPC|nr:hypothetical protein BpHYR1_035769 [Brachionus plicatilis]